MKSSNLFWGFAFITFGSLYLLNRYTYFDIDWYYIWDLWPVAIILMGISIIFKGTFIKPVISVVMGIILGVFIFGLINDAFDFDNYRDFRRKHVREYSENFYRIDNNDSIKQVNLTIAAGAGKFNIEKISDELVKGFSSGNIGKYEFTKSQIDSTMQIDVRMEEVGAKIFGKYSNDFQLSLNENPIYNFDLQIGAAKSYFNLIPFKVKNISLKTGATETKIKLGNRFPETDLNVEMGAASLKIYIPQTSGCKITGEMALVSKNLDGFIINGSEYVTDNFQTASEKIFINVNGGLASLEVSKY